MRWAGLFWVIPAAFLGAQAVEDLGRGAFLFAALYGVGCLCLLALAVGEVRGKGKPGEEQGGGR